MCFVCALAGAAKRPRPSAAAVAATADLMIPRLFKCSSWDISWCSALVSAGQQLRFGCHVLRDTHHEKFERLGACIREETRLANLDWNRVSRFDGRCLR